MNYAIHNLILWATDVSFFLQEADWTLNDSFRQSLIALWVTCLIWPAFELLSTCCCFIKHVKLTSCWLLKAKSGVIPWVWYALCARRGEGRVPVFKFWCVIESSEVRRGELQKALSICTRRHEEIGNLLHPCHLTLFCHIRNGSCFPGRAGSAGNVCVNLSTKLGTTWRFCSPPWGLHPANLLGLCCCSTSVSGLSVGGILT